GVRQRLPGRPPAGAGPRPGGDLRMTGSAPAPVVREAVATADPEACFAVRKDVFVAEQGVPEDIEYDAYDAGAVHVLAVGDDGRPLGTGGLLHGAAAAGRTGGGTAVGSLGRLGVLRGARGRGGGAALGRGGGRA